MPGSLAPSPSECRYNEGIKELSRNKWMHIALPEEELLTITKISTARVEAAKLRFERCWRNPTNTKASTKRPPKFQPIGPKTTRENRRIHLASKEDCYETAACEWVAPMPREDCLRGPTAQKQCMKPDRFASWMDG